MRMARLRAVALPITRMTEGRNWTLAIQSHQPAPMPARRSVTPVKKIAAKAIRSFFNILSLFEGDYISQNNISPL